MLNSTQKKKLRGLAMSLKPSILVGKQGITEALQKEIERALETHELIKIKIEADRDARKQIIAQIEEKLDCEAAGATGKTASLYRRSSDPSKSVIKI